MTQPSPALDARPIGRQRQTFSSPYFHRRQRRHFLLFDVLPTIGAIAAVSLLPWLPPTGPALALGAALWLATGLGISVGFHRLFSHRAFSAARPVAIALVILGSMAGRGPMYSWAAIHRRHHECADDDGDIHSPNLHAGRWRGWLHAHVTWMICHDYPNVGRYIPDLLSDRRLAAVNQRYLWWVALGLVLPTAIAGVLPQSIAGALNGLLWGGAVRIVVVAQTMSCINSLTHLFGRRPFASTGDRSGNLAWLAAPSWGEAWHNNHHAFPYSAAFGLRWYQLDPGLWLIKGLAACGLASEVKRPSTAQIAARLARPGWQDRERQYP